MACVGGLDTVSGLACEEVEGPNLEAVGLNDAGNLILVDRTDQSRIFIRTPAGSLVTGSAQDLQQASINGLAGADGGGGISDSTLATIAENRRQFDETTRRLTDEFNQRFEQDQQRLDNDIARDDELMRFNERKLAVSIEEGNKTRELQARTLIESITARRDRTQIERQAAITQARQWNASMAFEVDRENARRRTENIALQQQNAAMLAEAQQDPSDIGKVVSLLTSRETAAAGLRAAAERGESGITEESLLPIQELIGTETALAGGPDLATFDPIPLPQFEPLDTSLPSVEDISGFVDPALFGAANGDGAPSREGDLPIGDPRSIQERLEEIGQNVNLSDEDLIKFGAQFGLAHGGTTTATRFIVGDDPDSCVNATTEIVENPTGAPLTVRPGAKARGMPMFAEGTGFDFGIYGDLQGLIAATTAEVQAGGPGPASALMEQYTAFQSGGGVPGGGVIPPADDAKARQDKLVQDILAKLGKTDITELFPIKASAPGTTRFQQKAFQGGFTAAGFGDEELFEELRLRQRPTAVGVGATRRSA